MLVSHKLVNHYWTFLQLVNAEVTWMQEILEWEKVVFKSSQKIIVSLFTPVSYLTVRLLSGTRGIVLDGLHLFMSFLNGIQKCYPKEMFPFFWILRRLLSEVFQIKSVF